MKKGEISVTDVQCNECELRCQFNIRDNVENTLGKDNAIHSIKSRFCLLAVWRQNSYTAHKTIDSLIAHYKENKKVIDKLEGITLFASPKILKELTELKKKISKKKGKKSE